MSEELPPFRADQVGSLLRPAALKKAARAFNEGKLDEAGFHAAQDAAVRDAVARQREIGLEVHAARKPRHQHTARLCQFRRRQPAD